MSFSISPPLIFLTSYHGFSFIPFPKPRTFWIFPLPHPMSVGLWVTAEMPLHPSTADILSAFWGAPQCSWFPPQLSGLALEKVNLIILFHLKTSVTPVTSPIISVLLIISFYNWPCPPSLWEASWIYVSRYMWMLLGCRKQNECQNLYYILSGLSFIFLNGKLNVQLLLRDTAHFLTLKKDIHNFIPARLFSCESSCFN